MVAWTLSEEWIEGISGVDGASRMVTALARLDIKGDDGMMTAHVLLITVSAYNGQNALFDLDH